MKEATQLKLGQRGVVTLPKELREEYHLKTGDNLSLIDLGGTFVLSPRHSEIDAIADRVASRIKRKGESLESLLTTVREERDRYGKGK